METRLDAAAAKVNSKARRLDSTPGNGRRRRRKKDLILRVETKDGACFIRVLGNEIRRMTSEPNLENAQLFSISPASFDVKHFLLPKFPFHPFRHFVNVIPHCSHVGPFA
jgi:hypothetical protein